KDADDLAAAILMPEDATKQVMTDHDIDLQKKIGLAEVKTIASKFEVSMFVAVQRLRALGFKVPYIPNSYV
ncbi:MAG: ImmA/IrrE family metallo-endopeptidase, partial [Chlamydiota bacterium]